MMTTPIRLVTLVQLVQTVWITAALVDIAACSASAEHRVTSPDGRLALIISDAGGLRCRVEVDGQPLLEPSRLGLEFAGGVTLGPAAVIQDAKTAQHDGTWENRFGKRRIVRDRWNETRLTLEEPGTPTRHFGLIARAYDDGVAFRYELPRDSKLGEFTLTRELTEFVFAGDYRCWAGEPSDCAENNYPETTLSAFHSRAPTRTARRRRISARCRSRYRRRRPAWPWRSRNFHGAYKPTGLARTWPNYITQEGVLGNEYHKIALGKCTPQHTITLPFTRGLLGPMDVTPGGFLNRTAAEFKIT